MRGGTNWDMTRTFVAKFESNTLQRIVQQALDWINWETVVRPGDRVFIKADLTWSSHMPGVTTSPEFIKAIVEVIRPLAGKVIVGESDGGYHSFDAEEAFESHDLYELADRHGVQVVNLIDLP